MFDNIAHRYDFKPSFVLRNRPKLRRKAIRWLNQHHSVEGQQVMDMATGTGDFAIDLAKRTENISIVALDLFEQMLSKGRQKSSKKWSRSSHHLGKRRCRIPPLRGQHIFSDDRRLWRAHLGDIRQGLREMHRILKPGAPLIVLEVSQPKNFPCVKSWRILSWYSSLCGSSIQQRS